AQPPWLWCLEAEALPRILFILTVTGRRETILTPFSCPVGSIMAKKKAAATPTETQAQPIAPESGAARSPRSGLVREIERLRRSRVVTYICSDRAGAAGQIGEDVVRPMYDHLRPAGRVEAIDLYLYSRGGAVEVPWRIVSMLGEHCSKLGVL